MTIEGFINRVRSLNAKDLIIKAVREREAELADLNVEQLEKSKYSTGETIEPEYSSDYASFKGFKNPDLKLTGDFHSGIFADVQGDVIEFDSTDFKASKLQGKYGDDIFGVTDEGLIETADMDLPEIIDNELTR